MSEQLNALELENKNLKVQAENNSKGVEQLLSNLDAHKQMLNEQLQTSLALRTNLITLSKQNQNLTAQVEDLKKKLDAALSVSKAEAA